METQADFVIRLSNDARCHFHKNKTPRHYTIKKYNTMVHGEMGYLGWVIEKVRKNYFWLCLPKDLTDKANVSHLADKSGDGRIYQRGKKDASFYIVRNSRGEDYQNAVRAVSAIKEVR